MRVIIFDFEVFKYDTLFGCIVLDEQKEEVVQIWDLNEFIKFYYSHKDCIWIGHNNDAYDNHIIKAILEKRNVYRESKSLINNGRFRGKAELDIYTYDLMCCKYYSLKLTELLIGKSIHTTDVSFDLDRELTDEEKRLTEGYNLDDLLQTKHNFYELKSEMLLRLRLIKEFDIDKKFLTATEARLAALALHARQIAGIEYKYVAPKIYDTLQIKNQEVIDFYLREGFRNNEKLTVTLCGVEHQLGSGGIHAALKKCHENDMLYLDVSGYYNLVMINYDLLPRTIPQEGKDLYEYMYHQQLALKGVDNAKRSVYKTILLAVFGASMNKYTDFYDPQIGSLITITGQLFLVDLLEKLEGKIKLIQSNTDGIIVKPLPQYSEEDVLSIVKEWCTRTGFVIKPKKITNLHQRDVNCYCYDVEDSWDVKGDAFVGSFGMETPLIHELYVSKEPAIVGLAVKDYFLNKIKPEQTIKEHIRELRFFQYLCKKLSYDYCTYESTNIQTGITTSEYTADLNRCFALKYDGETINVIVKHKSRDGKEAKAKLPNMPDNYFIFNKDILNDETIDELVEKIDYQWYIDRSYKRIAEFYDFQQIKEICL